MPAPENRPARKQKKPSEARWEAPASLKWVTPFLNSKPNQEPNQPVAQDDGRGGTSEVM